MKHICGLETFHDLCINQFGHHENLGVIYTYILIWILKEIDTQYLQH